MKRSVLILAVAAALFAPSAALGSGVVLKVQKATGLVAVRTSPARVELVHTSAVARLRVGERVALKARRLRNGTLAASRVSVLGRTTRTSFRGVLLTRDARRLVVSDR